MAFIDRRDAGQKLARALAPFSAERPIVLALPRGGVPVGFEVAQALSAPLDVLVVRKLGAPFQPELGVGALAEDGTRWVNTRLCGEVGIRPEDVDAIAAREAREVERRVARYRSGRPLPALAGRTVLLVDDGLATGGTARAGLRALKHLGAARTVLAIPVGPPETVDELRQEADEVVCLEMPEWLDAIGLWYEEFGQVSDDEVVSLLAESSAREPARP